VVEENPGPRLDGRAHRSWTAAGDAGDDIRDLALGCRAGTCDVTEPVFGTLNRPKL